MADNDDVNEETLDGKKTTHGTTLVLYQPGFFGPLPKRTQSVNGKKKKRALVSNLISQEMLKINCSGKRPPVRKFLGKVDSKWFQYHQLFKTSLTIDLHWLVARLLPEKLFEMTVERHDSKLKIFLVGVDSMLQ